MSGGSGYGGKPRSAVIVQDDRFETLSVVVCPLTSVAIEAPLFRSVVDATPLTGLTETSRLMIDKMISIPRAKLGKRIGQLGDADTLRMNRAIVIFLGIA
jgi:mRNA interferase MazF